MSDITAAAYDTGGATSLDAGCRGGGCLSQRTPERLQPHRDVAV
jgi:hypothetical protein